MLILVAERLIRERETGRPLWMAGRERRLETETFVGEMSAHLGQALTGRAGAGGSMSGSLSLTI